MLHTGPNYMRERSSQTPGRIFVRLAILWIVLLVVLSGISIACWILATGPGQTEGWVGASAFVLAPIFLRTLGWLVLACIGI